MVLTIKKGKHRAQPRLGLFYAHHFTRKVISFRENCKYLIPGPDQEDTNKLFGLGYLWNHHKESARFGWRYDPASGLIILSAYCYIRGERVIKDLARTGCREPLIYTIYEEANNYRFGIMTPAGDTLCNEWVPKFHKKKFSFPLGFYFGGNQPAPHQMEIEIKNL